MSQDEKKKICQKAQSIRQYYRQHLDLSSFITYAQFFNNFKTQASICDKQSNRQIISLNLKFRQMIFEEMLPYKWTPILIVALINIVRLRSPPIFWPIVYVYAFDYYFQAFFCWLHGHKPIININLNFSRKIVRLKNKIKRIMLLENLGLSDKMLSKSQTRVGPDELPLPSPEIPHKYLKFGDDTEYLFHSSVSGFQQTNILQTRFFELYNSIMTNTITQTLQNIASNLSELSSKFKEFQKNRQENIKLKIDVNQQLTHRDVKANEVGNMSAQIESRIRRFIEISIFHTKRTLFYSGFSIENWSYLYQHQGLLPPYKYCIQRNEAELGIYMAAIFIPYIFMKIIRRRS